MKRYLRIILPTALAVLLVALLLVGLYQIPVYPDGSLDVSEKVELTILKRHLKEGVTLPDQPDAAQIRENVNGRVHLMAAVYSGRPVELFATDVAVDVMKESMYPYYFVSLKNVTLMDDYTSRITRTALEVAYAVTDEKALSVSLLDASWGALMEYVVHPNRIFSPFTKISQVWCMEDYQGVGGYYLCFVTSEGDYVLYGRDQTAYLVPLADFREACRDAVDAYEAAFEQTGMYVGVPDPLPYLAEFERADLAPKVHKEPEQEMPVEEKTDMWVYICIAEVLIGAVLLPLMLLGKRRLGRYLTERRAARAGAKAPAADAESTEQNDDAVKHDEQG